MERHHDVVRLVRGDRGAQPRAQRRNVAGMIEIRRDATQGRHEHAGAAGSIGGGCERRVIHRRGCRRGILRKHRHHDHGVDPGGDQIIERPLERRPRVGHAENHAIPLAKCGLQLRALLFGFDEQRRALRRPDALIQLRRFPRPQRQDDAAQQRLPQPRWIIDDPAIGQEVRQVALDRRRRRRLGRAHLREKNAGRLGHTSAHFRSRLWYTPVSCDGGLMPGSGLIDAADGGIKIEQQGALAVVADHALQPEERRRRARRA